MIDKLKQLFEDNSIGCIGVRNSNGADGYNCPCCYAYKRIMGCASFNSHITEVEHEDGCELYALYKELEGK